VYKVHKVWKEEVNQKEPSKTSKELLALLNTFWTIMVQQGETAS
jgi:hypothetical protein